MRTTAQRFDQSTQNKKCCEAKTPWATATITVKSVFETLYNVKSSWSWWRQQFFWEGFLWFFFFNGATGDEQLHSRISFRTNPQVVFCSQLYHRINDICSFIYEFDLPLKSLNIRYVPDLGNISQGPGSHWKHICVVQTLMKTSDKDLAPLNESLYQTKTK